MSSLPTEVLSCVVYHHSAAQSHSEREDVKYDTAAAINKHRLELLGPGVRAVSETNADAPCVFELQEIELYFGINTSSLFI